MQDKKYQIFVSSTYTDLKDARQKVIDAILKMYQFPVGMEMFGAADDDQWTVIRELISQSDYYVVIIGRRYGSLSPEGISYTEKEYDYAREQGVPVLAFLMNDDVALIDSQREHDVEMARKIEEFRKKAKSSKLVDWWSTEEQLVSQVSVALHKALYRYERVGWIRADRAASETTVNEIAELSRINRELRDEVERLRNRIVERTPAFLLKFNGQTDITVEYKEPNPSEYRTIDKLSIHDIPVHLREFVTEEQIHEYNESLPDRETILEYQSALRTHQLIRGNAQDVLVSVLNTGTEKARDINITLDFPVEFMVITKSDFEAIEPPKAPLIPVSPIQQASQKYQHKNLPVLLKQLPSFLQINSSISDAISIPKIKGVVDYSFLSQSPNHSLKIQNNCVSIWVKELLHRQKHEFEDELLIIPTQLGSFEVPVVIVCEELAEPLEYKIFVNV